MKMKLLISSIATILFLIIIYFGIYNYQNNKINKINELYLLSLDDKPLTEVEKNKYKMRRCNLDIFNQEYYNFSGGDNDALITFYKINKDLFLNKIDKNNFENYFSGFSRVKNTTFDNLLSMVKEDCYQFKKDYNWAETWNKPEAKTELRWKWSRAETEKEKRKEKEKEERKRKEFEKMLKERGVTEKEYRESQKLTPEEKKIQDEVLKQYGF